MQFRDSNIRRLLVVILPLMLLNFKLIGWMAQDSPDFAQSSRYLWTMTLLVFFEAPLMSVLITLFLGKTLFLESPHWRDGCPSSETRRSRIPVRSLIHWSLVSIPNSEILRAISSLVMRFSG